MKRIFQIPRRSVSILFAALILTILFGTARETRAQTRGAKPFVDSVEREYSNGAATNNYIAYFGYDSYAVVTIRNVADDGEHDDRRATMERYLNRRERQRQSDSQRLD